MKIRQGFISNSSTTSFTVCGFWYLDREEANEHLGVEDIYDLYKKENLQVYTHWDSCTGCVGLHIDEMREDETKRAFRARAAAAISKATGKEFGPDSTSFITDGWEDR